MASGYHRPCVLIAITCNKRIMYACHTRIDTVRTSYPVHARVLNSGIRLPIGYNVPPRRRAPSRRPSGEKPHSDKWSRGRRDISSLSYSGITRGCVCLFVASLLSSLSVCSHKFGTLPVQNNIILTRIFHATADAYRSHPPAVFASHNINR